MPGFGSLGRAIRRNLKPAMFSVGKVPHTSTDCLRINPLLYKKYMD